MPKSKISVSSNCGPGEEINRFKWIKSKKNHCLYWLANLLILMSAPLQSDIYFSSKTIGPSTNIYAVNTDGLIKKMTRNQAWRDTNADISSQGELVFMSNRKPQSLINLNKTREDFNIFKMSVETGELNQLTFSAEIEHSPRISRDGNWITYIQKSGKFQKLMLLKNSELTPKTVSIADDIRDVCWSHNNILSFIRFNKDRSQLILFDPTTHTQEKILEATQDRTLNKELPQGTLDAVRWSPDGKKIAYILGSNEYLSRELFVMDLWAKKSIKISDAGYQVQKPVSWSADSHNILYSALVDYQYYFDESTLQKVYKGSMQVFLSQLNGKTQQVTTGNHLHNRPTFSPNGKKIAFLFGSTLADRTLDLYIYDLENQQQQALYNQVSTDSFLLWQ